MEKLQSGKPYKIIDLFTDNRHIIIPDLQRDYCWGDKKHGDNNAELVSGFIESLNEIFKENREIKLGMIYAYEYPKDSNRIYLCDGQQRITTLFLLLGMLNKYLKYDKIKNCLISEFELNDDKEPRLQYAIRESTLYFLSDLVCNFFLDTTESKVSEIKKKQGWYFNEYNLDPTIQSMISAMEIIEQKLEGINNLRGFADFLLNKIEFFYFDMDNRETGEDMFVVINTTGEPLTATENIKPLLIGNIEEENRKEASDLWEKWEKYFWENKFDKEHEADNGLNDFLTWFIQIKNKVESVDLITSFKKLSINGGALITIKEIDKLFEVYKLLISYWKSDVIKVVLNTITEAHSPRIAEKWVFENGEWKKGKGLDTKLSVVVTLLSFMNKISSNEKEVYQFLRRLRKNCFDYWFKERNQNHIDWRYILQIIEKSSTLEECLLFSEEFNQIGNLVMPSEKWFNLEEQLKIPLKKERQELIESWEDHQDFMGDLGFLFSIEPNSNTIEKLQQYFNNYRNTIDLVRNKDESKPVLSNYFRLFRLLIGCDKVGHINHTSGFEGVLFSTINREHLKKSLFKKLCVLENQEEEIIFYLKDKIKSLIIEQNIFDLGEFSTDKFIKSWLTLKVVNAVNHNVCLSYYENNGIAAYFNKDNNKLLETEPFSLDNSICGFGVKRGFGASGNYINYTQKEHWLKTNIIDTPFSSIALNKNQRTKEQILENKKMIDDLIRQISN